MTNFNKQLFDHINSNDINGIISDLLSGADPNVEYDDKYALIEAIGNEKIDRRKIDSPDIIRLLLSFGANPNVKDKNDTPLTKAVLFNDVESVKMLLEYGADPNIIANRGITAIHYTVNHVGEDVSKHNEIFDMLIKAGADINHQDNLGNTTLIFASMVGDIDRVKALLANGADVSIKNNKGQTFMDVADIRTLVGLTISKTQITDEKFEELKKKLDTFFLYNEKEKIDLFLKFLRDNDVPEDEIRHILEYAQQVTPKVAYGETYPRSGRPKTTMRRLLPATPPKIDKKVRILDNFDINSLCFCLNEPSGKVKETVAIPVTRYELEPGHGFYGRGTNPNVNYTWYYIEPDSDLYLISDRVFVGRNKITMFIQLYKEFENKLEEIGKLMNKNDEKELEKMKTYYEEKLKQYFNVDNIDWDVIIDDKELVISKSTSVTSNSTNYLRNLQTGKIGFEGGVLDNLDSLLGSISSYLGYDILVFTHQPGNYGRLVAECLDVRNRMTSLASIVKL